jgi:ribosomal-protein-alanine N-acetyltransferase
MRKISISDARSLSQMHCELFEQGWSENDFEKMLKTGDYFGFISDEGFIIGRKIIDEVEIFAIGVLQQFQHKGLGTKFMQAFAVEAQKLEAKTIFLEVNENNVFAKKLYLSNGYTTISTRANYYDNQTAIIMKKDV